MARRGTYRGIYSSLPDDPDFQALTPHARLIFYTARCCPAAGPACIFRFYPEVLSKQAGLSLREVTRALTELQAADWIRVEGPILWIRNGLRYDPTFRLADPKHQKAVMTKLEGLPRLNIVLTFCDYYDLPRPFEGPSKGPGRPIPEVGGSSAPISDIRVPNTDTPNRIPRSDQEGSPETLARSARVSRKSPPGFEHWWDAYPKKVGKDAARKAWQQKDCEPRAGDVIAGLAKQTKYLNRDGGKYIPNPATWLNQGRWQDDPPVNGHMRGFGNQDMSGLEAFLEAHKNDLNQEYKP